MRKVKKARVIAVYLAAACGALLLSHPAEALQKRQGVAVSGGCYCKGGHGSCSSKSGGGLVSCYKAKDDTCTGSCDFSNVSAGAKKGTVSH
jgi:hypothetical protein